MSLIKLTRLSAKQMREDRAVIAALEKVEGYTPAQPELSLEQIRALITEMETLQAGRVQAEAAAKSANDDATAKELEFHRLVMRIKKLILAQFGEDSNEAQEIGLKKKSEYKTKKRKPEPVAA